MYHFYTKEIYLVEGMYQSELKKKLSLPVTKNVDRPCLYSFTSVRCSFLSHMITYPFVSYSFCLFLLIKPLERAPGGASSMWSTN